MGKVYINGKAYDSITGLKLNIPDELDATVTNNETVNSDEVSQTTNQKLETLKQPVKRRRTPKQELLAKAVAREFENEDKHPKPSSRSEKSTKVTPVTPNWINNFNKGNPPIEIQPIKVSNPHKNNQIHRDAPNHHSRKRLQRSSTLNRNFVKKPMTSSMSARVARRVPVVIEKHPNVQKFAPYVYQQSSARKIGNDIKKQQHNLKTSLDAPFIPLTTHKTIEKIAQNDIKSHSVEKISGVELKNFLIKNQLDKPVKNDSSNHTKLNGSVKPKIQRHFAKSTLVTAALAVLVLGGYFTYVNMPSLSIKVAANKAGINTSSPYTPSGYSIDGPVAYSPGRITIKYKSNNGAPGYSITGQSANLNNSEVLESFVSSESSQYEKQNVNGITVYEHDGDATWMTNGVLYKLNGNELLSDEQISKIIQSV